MVDTLEEFVVQHLGLLGQMSKTRDVNAAGNSAKRQVVRDHPNKFCLDGKVPAPGIGRQTAHLGLV